VLTEVKMSRLTLRPTQLPIHWVVGRHSLAVKWPGHETNHSTPSSAMINFDWSCTSTPPYASMASLGENLPFYGVIYVCGISVEMYKIYLSHFCCIADLVYSISLTNSYFMFMHLLRVCVLEYLMGMIAVRENPLFHST
jgi:hypothetical protein